MAPEVETKFEDVTNDIANLSLSLNETPAEILKDPQECAEASCLIRLFALPEELRLHIFQQIVIKPGSAIGAPEPGAEVSPARFIQDYRAYRNLDLSLACRTIHTSVSQLFFSRNRFEFHYPADLCLFLGSITDEQRDRIFHISVYWGTKLPASIEIDMEAYKFRHFPTMSESEIQDSFRKLSNCLVLSRSCNRLRSLQVKFRHLTHLESLNRPVQGIWETAWRENFYKPPVPVLDAPFAIWDYTFTNVLEFLSFKDKECGYDIDYPYTNALAKDIDHFVDTTDVSIEMYDIEADCDALRDTIQDSRLSTTVRDESGQITHSLSKKTCLCCSQTMWRVELVLNSLDSRDLPNLSQFCSFCRTCDGSCETAESSGIKERGGEFKDKVFILAEAKERIWVSGQ